VIANQLADARTALANAERAIRFLQAQNNNDYLRWVREENMRKQKAEAH
jgi:hypothetical protein